MFTKNMTEIIEINPKVLGGMPVIKGTRIPVARIVALHIQGYKLKDLKSEYPYLKLTKQDLKNIYTYYSGHIG